MVLSLRLVLVALQFVVVEKLYFDLPEWYSSVEMLDWLTPIFAALIISY